MSNEFLKLLVDFEDISLEDEFVFEEVTVKSALTEYRPR